ncbi:MAG: ATP-dependent DNA helicase [Xanthomonadaceae bacterium]|nr:ATP-dependent DNA helicase [Xanthomonadaceae bacterium]
MSEVAELLGAGGPLARVLDGFSPRRDQQRMAEAVSDALAERRVLVVEAGTGTGKTFAYLVPALTSGLKVLVSTGTKNLQDQLFRKDLPAVREALGRPVSVALLKGRANYLCTLRLEQAQLAGRFDSRAGAHELQVIKRWAGTTADGDIAGVEGVPEDSSIWPWVTSTAENCLGSKCAHYDECFVLDARRRALAADVVVINHHLLFADLMLKESGFGELLPGADAVIVDEAHQLAETASQFFGTIVTGRQIGDLARDATAAFVNDASDTPDLKAAADVLDKAEKELRLALRGANRGSGPLAAIDSNSRLPWARWPNLDEVEQRLDEVDEALARLVTVLSAIAGRAAALEQALDRTVALRGAIREVREHVADPESAPSVRWIETFRSGYALHVTPLDVSGPLAKLFSDPPRSWVFTSATLAVGERFDHFSQALGLAEPDTLQLGSPFDYEHNAVLYVPEDLPEPNTPGFTRGVLEAALPVIAASGGRAFLLFTSHRALREAAEFLEGRFAFPLLVQGTAPRDALLREFRERGNAVLLGTGSFWEGVDVRGPALSVVVIDKLPFAAPDDPVLAARIEAISARGGNAFIEHQLPRAVISLKQGVGRLIRDADDTGVISGRECARLCCAIATGGSLLH